MNDDPSGKSMDRPVDAPMDRLEVLVFSRLGRQVRHLRVVVQDGGLILQGQARTFYAKQVAQHVIMEATGLRILANEIQVA